jgi:glutamyl-tRNA synthetase
MSSAAIVTRFAPSPTGELHLGNVRTALFNWLLARSAGGQFVLRIEDTDSARSEPRHTAQILADLAWLGLDWEQGPDVGGPAAPYLQSQRGQRYDAAFETLATQGLAYPCFCSTSELEARRRAQIQRHEPPRYAGTCRDLPLAERRARLETGAQPTLRFRVPAGEQVVFDDLVHGEQRFATDGIGDFVIRRADGSAAFFFCNALDDADMGVTHVLRGEDHLSNTPRQLLLLDALERPAPRYGHLALLVGDDGAPLSKRRGAASLRQLREAGYLALALRNLLFRLGHSSPANGLLDATAMARAFDLRHLGRSAARFDAVQLQGWQKDSVQQLPLAELRSWVRGAQPAALPADLPEPQVDAFLTAVRANVVMPADVATWAAVVYGEPAVPDANGEATLREAGPDFFRAAAQAFDVHGTDWPAFIAALRAATARKGPALFRPLRYALTGVDHGPELAPLLRLMPAARVRARLLRYTSIREP